MKRVMTGIKVSGDLHLGNYQGAIRPIVAVSSKTEQETLLMCADWHGLTDRKRIAAPGEKTLEVLSALVCCGYDLKSSLLIRQSDFPEIQEVAWYLSCVSSAGLLERSHAYKDAVANGKEATAGLLYYPVLMAADIVTFDSDLVPVGKDQAQHLEFASDMVRHFNTATGTLTFKEPLAEISKDLPLLLGTDGERKMSKSYGNEIPLFTSKKDLEKRVKEIKTDSKGLHDPKNPDSCLLFQLFCSFARPEAQRYMRERLEQGVGYGYGHAKKDFVDEHEAVFGVQRERYEFLSRSSAELAKLLEPSLLKAKNLAQGVKMRARASLKLPLLFV